MSKKAQVILLKNTGKNFIQKTNEIIKNKLRIEDVSNRLMKITKFKQLKNAFATFKSVTLNTNWKLSTIDSATLQMTKTKVSR